MLSSHSDSIVAEFDIESLARMLLCRRFSKSNPDLQLFNDMDDPLEPLTLVSGVCWLYKNTVAFCTYQISTHLYQR